MRISWSPPSPRDGWDGRLDRFIGPGATTAELALQFGGAVALTAAATAIAVLRAAEPWPALNLALLAVLTLDLSGGIITNATSSAKRWYHREGQRARQHMLFIVPHGVHLALLVWLAPGLGWWFGVLSYAYLLVAATGILAAPLYQQRPVALALYAGGLLLNLALAPPPEVAWFVPFFYLKLLLAHLLKEAPFRPEHERQAVP
jgi:hypothetical protein